MSGDKPETGLGAASNDAVVATGYRSITAITLCKSGRKRQNRLLPEEAVMGHFDLCS